MYNYNSNNTFRVLLLSFCIFAVFVRGASFYDDDFTEDDGQFTRTFDYIVVGLGQAGSVVAGRLSEAGTVLGIEAGPVTHRELGGKDYVANRLEWGNDGKVKVLEPHTRFDVPSFSTTIYSPPSAYESYPAVINGYPQSSIVGKLLGGSGAHNGMLFTRFERKTIDSWNVTGWKWNDVLPFYKKQENVTGSFAAAFPAYHGFDGPIQVNEDAIDEGYEAVPIWIAACNNSGNPLNPDFNREDKTGCGRHNFNIRRGVRDSSARAYLPKALKGGNFTMRLDSYVTKILIKKNATNYPEAYGVQFVGKNGITRRVYARKEIIVTASAVLTPKLLLLSGIGNATQLNALGIKVWVNNPYVGKGLQSNHGGPGRWEYPNSTYPNGIKIAQHATNYGLYGTGPWAHSGQYASAYAYSSNTIERGRPDVWVHTMTGGGLNDQTSLRYVIDTFIATNNPKVRGNVYISTKDPFAPPNVTINDYENIEDLKAMIAGVKLLRKIFTTYPASGVFGRELIPGPAYVTDAQIEQWVRTSTGARGHWVGSTKLGNDNDNTKVVDRRLRVVGVNNLRIGDCGVLPSVNSHSCASCNMVGERVSAFIIEDSS